MIVSFLYYAYFSVSITGKNIEIKILLDIFTIQKYSAQYFNRLKKLKEISFLIMIRFKT